MLAHHRKPATRSAGVGEPLCEQIDRILGHDCNVAGPRVTRVVRLISIMCNINLAGVADIQVTDKSD